LYKTSNIQNPTRLPRSASGVTGIHND